MQCYALEDFKLLLQFEADYQACDWERIVKDQEDDLLREKAAELLDITKLQTATIADLKAENTRLFEQWKVENKKRHEAENKPQLGSWVGWTVAGVATAALAGFVLHDALD